MAAIDLHTHSSVSDGTLSPAELILEAKKADLKAIAITDHDHTGGVAEAMQAGIIYNIEVVAGCEISATWNEDEIHIVGLFLPENPEALNKHLEWLREMRAKRNLHIVEKLQAIGVHINYERVVNIAGGGTVGRPHIARAIVQAGSAINIQSAFDMYLAPKARAYVPKKSFSMEKALALLQAEGATSILAHPGLMRMDRTQEKSFLKELKDMGLWGIEAYYSKHSKEQTAYYLALAKELDLVVSGGSDFHGSIKPDIFLGRGHGRMCIPCEVLESIKNTRQKKGFYVP